MRKAAFKAKNIELEYIKEDLIEKLWNDRPSKPTGPIYILDTKYAGKSVEDKFESIKEQLAKTSATTYIVTNLEEIACNCL